MENNPTISITFKITRYSRDPNGKLVLFESTKLYNRKYTNYKYVSDALLNVYEVGYMMRMYIEIVDVKLK